MSSPESPKSAPENADEANGGVADESCFIVDKSISVIEIGDETITNKDEEPEEGEISNYGFTEGGPGFSNDTFSGLNNFEVIDEVGSQEENSTESSSLEAGKTNGSQKTNGKEFCAPTDPVDLDETPKPAPQESATLIDIKFLNRKTYLSFQQEFVALIQNYYKRKLDDLVVVDDHKHNRIRVLEKKVKKSDAFLIDTTPTTATADMATPAYQNSFGNTILTGDKELEQKRKSITSTPKNNCFNCDKTGHSLRNCPEPRNMRKVNKARNEFNKRELRYHDDGDNNFAHFVPGVISDELRAALGLTATQLPLHVYKMRMFGYPPGWIEEAKIHNSGLCMFVDKDKKQLTPGEDEGETDVNNFKFDVQKIYDYPGFNVIPTHQYVDLHKLYNMPPILPQHSKELLIQSLGVDVVNGYKKTKIKDPTVVVDTTTVETADMDLEDEDELETQPLPPGDTSSSRPPLPDVSLCRPPEPMEDGELTNDSIRSMSPDEEELKAKRQRLMDEIENSSETPQTSSSSSQRFIDATIIENSENENRDNIAKDDKTGHVDETIFGCPVLPSHTPYNSLPSGEKFQEGVCDVINFENLAESTGKYERMKLLIGKVRTFQKRHQQE